MGQGRSNLATHILKRSTLTGCLCLLLAQPAAMAVAQSTETDFTFKRVKPPSASGGKRITIQIERTWPYRDAAPEGDAAKSGDAARAAAVAGTDAERKAAATLEWFWDQVPGDVIGANPDRLTTALSTIARNPGRVSADTALLDRILQEHGLSILAATAGKRVSPALVLAVIAVESSGRADAVSSAGAVGLMQLIAATAERFGVADRTDPKENIRGGATYLDLLMTQFKGDPILALAAYNSGENAVLRHGGVPPFAETRAYVPKVIAAWDKARLYCQSLPRYADDGCVFALDRSLAR